MDRNRDQSLAGWQFAIDSAMERRRGPDNPIRAWIEALCRKAQDSSDNDRNQTSHRP